MKPFDLLDLDQYLEELVKLDLKDGTKVLEQPRKELLK
jgi:hypothetical protein